MRIEKCKYTWSLREPENGQFEYAWMDRFISAMQKARIQVILDAPPTVFQPGWRISILNYLGEPLGAAQLNTYGVRQGMNSDSPAYRF